MNPTKRKRTNLLGLVKKKTKGDRNDKDHQATSPERHRRVLPFRARDCLGNHRVAGGLDDLPFHLSFLLSAAWISFRIAISLGLIDNRAAEKRVLCILKFLPLLPGAKRWESKREAL